MDFAQAPDAIETLCRDNDITRVVANREYPVNEARRDHAVTQRLESLGLEVEWFDDGCVVPPGEVLTRTGAPYSVFSPFKRRWLQVVNDAVLRDVTVSTDRVDSIAASTIERWPGVDDSQFEDLWPGGERAARHRLDSFLCNRFERYGTTRDFPAARATSTLSPYLSIGALSAREVVRAALETSMDLDPLADDRWISEIIWRDFYRHVANHFPWTSRGQPFRREYEAFPWRAADDDFEAWCHGRTGFPLVDAGMRQLLTTGWMHNRVRMVVAMFLTKHLLVDWRRGERFFMQHLVDGDFASNNGGWQWSASTGTDAAPYFRLFNPTSQLERFDPDGDYVRTYVPELGSLDGVAIARLSAGHEVPGYPQPIVDHSFARERAIETFRAFRDHQG